jgi:hypothetical protein
MDTITLYVAGYVLSLIVTLSLLVLKFNTNIIIHLLESFRLIPEDTYFTMEDIQKKLEEKYALEPWPKHMLPELWSCPVCLGTWIGLAVSTVVGLSLGAYFLPFIYFFGPQLFIAAAMQFGIIDH